ncbi:MAG: hypothetical protein DRI57_25130 [Deltaproteobacteria bacterium]|nr:MAG: hypothetical protein DRI57_25130 [Deltaproteobacteria bacterium]
MNISGSNGFYGSAQLQPAETTEGHRETTEGRGDSVRSIRLCASSVSSMIKSGFCVSAQLQPAGTTEGHRETTEGRGDSVRSLRGSLCLSLCPLWFKTDSDNKNP